MAVYYFDTSALVKRYFDEVGTRWVIDLTRPASAQDIYIARIAGPEVIAAFFGKVKRGETTSGEAILASEKFRTDFERQYQIVEVTAGVANRAMSLAQQHNLRGYDSVQLAAALELHIRRSGSRIFTHICLR